MSPVQTTTIDQAIEQEQSRLNALITQRGEAEADANEAADLPENSRLRKRADDALRDVREKIEASEKRLASLKQSQATAGMIKPFEDAFKPVDYTANGVSDDLASKALAGTVTLATIGDAIGKQREAAQIAVLRLAVFEAVQAAAKATVDPALLADFRPVSFVVSDGSVKARVNVTTARGPRKASGEGTARASGEQRFTLADKPSGKHEATIDAVRAAFDGVVIGSGEYGSASAAWTAILPKADPDEYARKTALTSTGKKQSFSKPNHLRDEYGIVLVANGGETSASSEQAA